jgi:histidine ammonia-lyase
MKSAEALAAEIVHLAHPVPVYPGGAADGVEDVVAHSAVPAKALLAIVERLNRLTALELVVGVQSVEKRWLEKVAPTVAAAGRRVRETVAPIEADRAMGDEIERLAERVAAGHFEMNGERQE